MKRVRILNQYRTEEGRKHWKEYAAGSREYGTRYNLMAFSCRADLKTTAVMAGGHINHLSEMYETETRDVHRNKHEAEISGEALAE